jgi:hypothetical protein
MMLSFIPFSTVFGGGVAGHLKSGGSATGAKDGALDCLVSYVPFVAIITVGLVFVTVAPGAGGGPQVAIYGLSSWSRLRRPSIRPAIAPSTECSART